jgi:hypothetical protein
VHFSFKDDLSFQTAQIRIVADEIVEFIRIVAMWHLIVGNWVGQIFGLVDRNINFSIGVRVAVDENMPLHR